MDLQALALADQFALDVSAHKVEQLAEQIHEQLLQASEHDSSKTRVINMRKMAEKIVHDTPVTAIPYR
jgi:hypothetical protein